MLVSWWACGCNRRFGPDRISYADLLRIGRRRKRDHKLGTFTVEPNSNSCKFHAHLNLAIICIALALLGPGAFSVDARLFGRREIIIPDSK